MEGYTRQSRTLTEYLEQVEKKKFLEILECEKQFKANPVPDFIHKKMPIDSKPVKEIPQENKDFKRNKETKYQNIDSKKPSSIIKLENENLNNILCQNSNTRIHKKDVNYNDNYKKELTNNNEEFLLKENTAKQRPQSAQARVSRTSEFKTPTFRPKINKYIPDHDKQYKNFLKHFTIQGRPKSTVCKPFNLHSPSPNLTNKEKSQIYDEKNNKFRRGSTGQLLVFMDAIPPRMTHTSLLRCANIKNQKVNEFKTKEKIIRSDELKKIQEMDLIKIVKEKVYVKNVDAEIEFKLKLHRQSNIEGQLDYKRKLELIKNELKERPLLLEQINKKKLIVSTNKCQENDLYLNADVHQSYSDKFNVDSNVEKTKSNSPLPNVTEYSKKKKVPTATLR